MLSFLKKLFGINSSRQSDFEISFSYLKDLPGSTGEQAQKVYDLLKQLSQDSTQAESDAFISEFQKLRIASNTNTVFFFYFPIVSHILYFKSTYAEDLLHYLVGPIFANGDGDEESTEMIRKIQRSMDFKLKENPKFLTKEGQLWVQTVLPSMEKEIQREIDICKKELEDL